MKKVGELYFGYKRHTVTDEKGLILAEVTTVANESDIKHLENPLKKTKLLGGRLCRQGIRLSREQEDTHPDKAEEPPHA